MKQRQLSHWLQHHPYGKTVYQQLQQQVGSLLGNQSFGHAVQLGLGELDFLAACKVVHQHIMAPDKAPIVTQLNRLPLPTESMDLVILPLLLSQSDQAHVLLREAQRVLCAYGQLVVVDINPHSLWCCRKKTFSELTGCHYQRAITPKHLADWMQLLDLQPQLSRFINYLPLLEQAKSAPKWQWLEAAGNRWWPHAAAMYAMTAVKQIVFLHPLTEAQKHTEKQQQVVLNPVSIRKPD